MRQSLPTVIYVEPVAQRFSMTGVCQQAKATLLHRTCKGIRAVSDFSLER